MKSTVAKPFTKGTLLYKSPLFNKGTTFQKGSLSNYKATEITSKEKGKEKVVEPSKNKPTMGKLDLSNKKCLKCQGCGHFQTECPNRRTFSLIEIQAIEESLQKDEENVDYGHKDRATE